MSVTGRELAPGGRGGKEPVGEIVPRGRKMEFVVATVTAGRMEGLE